MDKHEPPSNRNDAHSMRQLQPHERVGHGDYVPDGQSGFELWTGPTGFRADSFNKPIYRKGRAPSLSAKMKRSSAL